MRYIINKIDFLLREKKAHESDKTEIRVGDYLICNESYEKNIKLIKFLKNNVGVCVEIQDIYIKRYPYLVSYSNIPEYLRHPYNYFGLRSFGYNYDARQFSKENIRHATPEEIEEYKFNQNIHKYNL